MEPRFALLLACFFLSGFAALLYQTAWTRELSFVFGTSELAVAAVLAAYMGGLALGAAAAGRFAMRVRRVVLAYGLLELGIALSALAVPVGIRLINAAYVALLGGAGELPEEGGTAAALFQVGAAFAVLLPPTALMGATLPLLARHAVRSEREIGRRIGVLYAVNTVGAIAGTLCAAFWLMPEIGLRRTVWSGAAVNAVVFALAALLARGAASVSAAPVGSGLAGARARGPSWILPAIALSGAVSFTYEVLWTRLLGHVLGASLDAFATMLASFLAGIALGSAVAARVATTRGRAAVGFGVAQVGIAVTSYVAFALADRLPELSLALGAGPGEALASAAVAAVALLPVTLCIGATFPFAVRLHARTPEEAAGATARVYAWNTMGAIAGALGAGFVLLPGLGFAGTVNTGVSVSLALAGATFLLATATRSRGALAAGFVAVAGLGLFVLPARPPWVLLGSSPLRQGPPRADRERVYAAVGRSSTVLLFDQGSAFRLYSNGLPEAFIEPDGMLPLPKTARLLGQLPGLVRPGARAMLVVGLGGGSALESIPSTFESIDVIELEPEVLTANERIADLRAIDPLSDPRIQIHIGDARGLLHRTSRRYDAIVSQPSHPWTAGASHLYTWEFFEMVRSHLAPDGVFVQWIGLEYLDEALLRSLVATLVGVFGHVEAYQPGAGGGLVFAASGAPLESLSGVRTALRIAPEEHGRFGIYRVEDWAAMRVLDEAGTRALAEGGVPNTDDHNLLAARASRLGDAALDGRSVRTLFEDHDPLLRDTDGLDRSVLIRTLAATNFKQRALALTASEDEAVEETQLGWMELALGRRARAARHFERAFALAPGARGALEGLVASRALGRERAFRRETAERGLDEPWVSLLAARRAGAVRAWDRVAALDAGLARIAPGEPAFDEACRLRAGWRVATGDPALGAEAIAILDVQLRRQWTAADALLRAQAAIAAEQPRVALGALLRIADVLAKQPDGALAGAALAVADELPEEMARSVREKLRSRRRPRAGR